MLKRWLLFPALALAWLAAQSAHATGIASAETSAPLAAHALDGARLVSALRSGGYVVYFRHTATDFSKNDSQMTGYADCANQRLLSETGRRDARRIGERIRELGLAEGEVLASPFCRTLEHARLSFSGVVPAPALREALAGDYPGLKQLLSSPVEPGRNRWLVGHGTPFRTVAGPPHLAEGEAVVIAPQAKSWVIVARIAVDDWARLNAPP